MRRLAVPVVLAVALTMGAASPAYATDPAPVRTVSTDPEKVVESYNYAGTSDVDQELTAYYNPSESGRPWIAVVHGGSWAAGSRTNTETASAEFYAEGFNVFNIAYRLTTDYRGNPGAPWPAQRDDVVAAIDWVKANADAFGIDPERGALYGFSAGGHLAASAGLLGNGSARVHAVVSVSGVLQPHRVVDVAVSDPAVGHGGDFPTAANKTLMNWESVAMRCPRLTTWTDCNSRWSDFLPETHISADDPPVLILQGTADPAVPPQTGRAFSYWLTKSGVENTLTEGVNWGHTEALAFDDGWRQKQVMDFLKNATA